MTVAGVTAAVDAWVRDLAGTWWFRASCADHVVAVARLIDAVSPRPAVVHDQRAFFKERLALARAVLRWCPSPDRLGRWLIRVRRWFRVENLGAYLRVASSKGDPGTVLESHTKNLYGRAAEDWRDFSPATERALEGPRTADIKRVVAGLTGVLSEPDETVRERWRQELAHYWKQRRPLAARTVLRRLVGNVRNDVAILHAIGDAMTLSEAKDLLAA